MLKGNDKISSNQVMFILLTTIIGVGILSLPREAVEKAGTDGSILIILGGIVACIFTVISVKLVTLFTNKTIVEFGREIVTTPISNIVSIIFFIYYIIISAFEVRILAEVVKMFLLDDTPTEVIIISILLVSAYLVRGGIEGLARMAELILPIVIIPVFLLLLSLIPDLDFTNLLPLFRTNPWDIIKSVYVPFFSFIGYELVLFMAAYVKDTENLMKFNVLSILLVTFVYVVFFIVSLCRFGVNEVKHLLWPILSIMKTIDLPGAFIENIEGIVMGLWVLSVFASLSPFYYSSALILCKLFGLKEHRYFVLPIMPFIYALSLAFDNIATVYDIMGKSINYIGIFTVIAVPTIYLIVALIKKRKEPSDNV
ncbi:GerAB/ArcD/ProY family transporter [Caloranaerobacter azorensis]|uniref:Endospore germination permease n=1 Tax=Caloranaerobacter azorensis TaxID=116090 RepID=A0A6P1YFN4_9FIRM|nr:endospore germination permease [Caloranaerobacter azorensis]QIB27732.1 endospore germination permease [Caloranaerobacter azorensis]